MDEIILITFYPLDRDSGRVWLVYGHIHGGRNVSLGEFESKTAALEFCFQYTGIPVMQGLNYEDVLRRLERRTTCA